MVFEIMFAVRSAASFSSQTNALAQVVSSIAVASPKPVVSQKKAPDAANRYIFTKDLFKELQMEIQSDAYLLTITKGGAMVSTLTLVIINFFSDSCNGTPPFHDYTTVNKNLCAIKMNSDSQGGPPAPRRTCRPMERRGQHQV